MRSADSFEVHVQIPRLLGEPCGRGMGGGVEDMDAPSAVLDRGHHVGLGAVEQIHGEEVARDNRLGLGTQELRPSRSAPSRSGVDAVLLRISQTVDGATVIPRPANSPVMRRYPRASLSRAIRSTSLVCRRRRNQALTQILLRCRQRQGSLAFSMIWALVST